MTNLARSFGVFAVLAIIAWLPAQAAPGEDPVTISGRVTYLQLPTAAATRSTSIQYQQQMPDDAAAKISRYTAKAFSGNLGQIKTEKDVVQFVQTKGNQTTCYQSIGSTTGPNTGANNEQIVVLRGDVINICN